MLAALGVALALTTGCGRGDAGGGEDEEIELNVDASGDVSDGGAQGSAGAVALATAPSHDTPDGAMVGLLTAMRTGDLQQVIGWVSPEPASDRDSIVQTSRMNAMLGLDGSMFWLVDERRVVGLTSGTDSAEVRLDGYLVWCTGTGADDPKASCAQPNGLGDTQTTTYPAVKVGGQWYVRLDLNRGELIQGNPGRAGVAG